MQLLRKKFRNTEGANFFRITNDGVSRKFLDFVFFGVTFLKIIGLRTRGYHKSSWSSFSLNF